MSSKYNIPPTIQDTQYFSLLGSCCQNEIHVPRAFPRRRVQVSSTRQQDGSTVRCSALCAQLKGESYLRSFNRAPLQTYTERHPSPTPRSSPGNRQERQLIRHLEGVLTPFDSLRDNGGGKWTIKQTPDTFMILSPGAQHGISFRFNSARRSTAHRPRVTVHARHTLLSR